MLARGEGEVLQEDGLERAGRRGVLQEAEVQRPEVREVGGVMRWGGQTTGAVSLGGRRAGGSHAAGAGGVRARA